MSKLKICNHTGDVFYFRPFYSFFVNVPGEVWLHFFNAENVCSVIYFVFAELIDLNVFSH